MGHACRSIFMVACEPIVLVSSKREEKDTPGRIVDAATVGLVDARELRPGREEGGSELSSRLRTAGDGRDGKSLTSRQESVLELCAQGLTYKEIGAELYISESTVRFHMQELKKSLEVRSKAELIALAVSSRLISVNRELAPKV